VNANGNEKDGETVELFHSFFPSYRRGKVKATLGKENILT